MKNKPRDIPYCGVREDKIKSAKPVLNKESLSYLYQFIRRRYIIHLRKDVWGKKPPWTKDEVLQEFRFTNIRREHDRETKWLIEHVAINPDVSYEDKLLNCILFRLFNKHETSELINMPIHFNSDWDPECYRHLFEEKKAKQPQVKFFTGAFNTGGLKRELKRYLPKDDPNNIMEMRVMHFMRYLLDQNITYYLTGPDAETQEDVFNCLHNFMGIGEFLGYQMFVDMTYIKEFPFSENEFTVAGPGCKMGLDYLFDDRDGMTYEECLFWVRDNLSRVCMELLDKELDPKTLFLDLPEYDQCFNVMSLENCFCELSKYIRAKTDSGRPRKKYRPTNGG